jgi:hypothetical protein
MLVGAFLRECKFRRHVDIAACEQSKEIRDSKSTHTPLNFEAAAAEARRKVDAPAAAKNATIIVVHPSFN